jgi:hypothetical protein
MITYDIRSTHTRSFATALGPARSTEALRPRVTVGPSDVLCSATKIARKRHSDAKSDAKLSALVLFYSVSRETGGPGSLLPNLTFDGPPRLE